MDTDSFTEYIKADDICEGVAEDVETRFNTSSCGLDRSLPNRTNKKLIRLIKDELVGKILINLLD